MSKQTTPTKNFVVARNPYWLEILQVNPSGHTRHLTLVADEGYGTWFPPNRPVSRKKKLASYYSARLPKR
jgi:hypothetical protein